MTKYSVIRQQIRDKAKQRYPKMKNFNLTDKAIEKFLKNNDNDIEDIVDELYHHIGDKGDTPTYIKLMNEDDA